MVVASPDSQTLVKDEYDVFTETVVCLDDAVEFPATPVITNVVVTGGNVEVTYEGNVFTIHGPITGVFDKSISFLDVNNAVTVVPDFVNLPAEYNALFKYVAPTTPSKLLTILVEFLEHDQILYEVTVNHNWRKANTELVVSVARGKF